MSKDPSRVFLCPDAPLDCEIGTAVWARSEIFRFVRTGPDNEVGKENAASSRSPHCGAIQHSFSYIRTARSRSALPTTLTDESAIAAAAMTGESSNPNVGYRMPAAIGIPAAL